MTREEFVVLSTLAGGYGCQILFYEEYPDYFKTKINGPRDASIWWKRQAVICESQNDDGDDVLHELTHLILGTWSAPENFEGPDESWLLMPFEWRLALWVMKRLPNNQRKDFIRHVRTYQNETACRLNSMYKYSYWRRSPVWKRSEQIAVEAGLLTEKREPSFVRPDYNTQRRLARRYYRETERWNTPNMRS